VPKGDTLLTLGYVLEERYRQDARHGPVSVRRLSPTQWLAILVEEVGEAAEAMQHENYVGMENELVQVAAVAVAMIEAFNTGER
jgi:NTP pyrophosphatase (non-canonical NTP hydrolase)